MEKRLLFRNDDVNYLNSVWHFKRVNDLFKKYNIKHYVAVLFEHLFENYELAHLLVNEDNIIINFHGWTHLAYGKLSYEKCVEDIKKSLAYWDENCARRYSNKKKLVQRSFPTWHLVSDDFKRASEDCGLIFDARKTRDENVNVFHHWSLISDDKLTLFETLLERESKKPE